MCFSLTTEYRQILSYIDRVTFHVLLKMTLDDSSNELSGGTFLVEETSSGLKECLVWAVRYELFSFMNAHVISSARWRYNPQAVTREFSLALMVAEERKTQRHHTDLVGCYANSSPCRFYPPNDDKEQLLRWCFEFVLDVYFLWQRNREHKIWFGGDGSVCSAIPGMTSEKSVSHF